MIYYDRNGVPLYKGDLIKSLHFIGYKGKKYYLYHTVVEEHGNLFLVPTSHLEPTLVSSGGKCPLDAMSDTWASEVVMGYGPEPHLTYEDRPKGEKWRR